LPLNCASVRRTSQARIDGEWGVKGWGCRRRGRLIDSLAHLRLVPEARARVVQRGLVGHNDAKRCPRISRWWTRSVGLQDFHRDDFGANLRGCAVKTLVRATPSVMRSSVDLPSGARCGRSARAPAHLEASHSAMSMAGTWKRGTFTGLLHAQLLRFRFGFGSVAFGLLYGFIVLDSTHHDSRSCARY